MKTLSNYKKVFIGIHDGESIYLSPPSWDCGWYWGFGYLGNRNCHYHVSGMNPKVNLHDAFLEHFGGTLQVRPSDLWTLSELFQTFYLLKNTTEILGSGSANLTNNPCRDLIINTDEVTRINSIVLPQVFEEIYKILYRNQDNEELYQELVSLNLKGNTKEVVSFMKENSIKPDDLKVIKGLTKDDCYIIHSFYWKDFHSNK